MSFTEAIHGVKDQMGETLFDLSMTSPVMVVFLRHFGCTFCREALSDLQRMRADIEKHGTQLAIIHMSPDYEAEFMLGRYGLESVHRISDPFRRVYKAFDLRRGTASQLLGLQVWWRDQAGLLKGHGLGAISGDALQLPGVFMIWKGRWSGNIVTSHPPIGRTIVKSRPARVPELMRIPSAFHAKESSASRGVAHDIFREIDESNAVDDGSDRTTQRKISRWDRLARVLPW